MFFQTVVCNFQGINMKRFSVSEDDNKVGSQDRLAMFLFINKVLYYMGFSFLMLQILVVIL